MEWGGGGGGGLRGWGEAVGGGWRGVKGVNQHATSGNQRAASSRPARARLFPPPCPPPTPHHPHPPVLYYSVIHGLPHFADPTLPLAPIAPIDPNVPPPTLTDLGSFFTSLLEHKQVSCQLWSRSEWRRTLALKGRAKSPRLRACSELNQGSIRAQSELNQSSIRAHASEPNQSPIRAHSEPEPNSHAVPTRILNISPTSLQRTPRSVCFGLSRIDSRKTSRRTRGATALRSTARW